MAVQEYWVYYFTATGKLEDIRTAHKTSEAGVDRLANAVALPADFTLDSYRVDLRASPLALAKVSDAAVSDHDELKGLITEAYTFEYQVIRPRLHSLALGNADAEEVIGKWLNSRWQALRNAYQGVTVHVDGTATTMTQALRKAVIRDTALGPSDGGSVIEIAELLATASAPSETLAQGFTNASGTRVTFANAVTWGAVDSTWKFWTIDWLNTSPGSLTRITDTIREAR